MPYCYATYDAAIDTLRLMLKLTITLLRALFTLPRAMSLSYKIAAFMMAARYAYAMPAFAASPHIRCRAMLIPPYALFSFSLLAIFAILAATLISDYDIDIAAATRYMILRR